jgi:hypothetical protein
MKQTHVHLIALAVVLAANALFYWGGLDNYFFSDDFEWLSRGITMRQSFKELVVIEGRDFNPVYLLLLWILIKLGGLSPVIYRVLALLVFSGLGWMFYHLLARYFKINAVTALSAVLLTGFNCYISEVVLNFSALVYSLSLLFFMLALTFHLDRKRLLFILCLAAAFLTKETIILGLLPLIFYEKENKHRLFVIASAAGFGLIRVLLQVGASGSYTSFLSFDNVLYKLYFILLRSMNLSPYTAAPAVGAAVILLFLGVSVYLSWKRREFLFFLLFFLVFVLFFALLPRLSSRYIFYPSLGFWGTMALAARHFHEHYFQPKGSKSKMSRFILVPLVLVSMLFNYPVIQREIGDYEILGQFSREFIRVQGEGVKRLVEEKAAPGSVSVEITLYKGSYRQLTGVYRRVMDRQNLPKLLPFRPHGIGGVIEPADLVPLAFYPHRTAGWKTVKETDSYIVGRVYY